MAVIFAGSVICVTAHAVESAAMGAGLVACNGKHQQQKYSHRHYPNGRTRHSSSLVRRFCGLWYRLEALKAAEHVIPHQRDTRTATDFFARQYHGS